jgi:hypothetical protein
MGLGTVVIVPPQEPLERALAAAFERFHSAEARAVALVFALGWRPTMDIVDIVLDHLARSGDIEVLTLVHPSAAMTFIASTIELRARGVSVRAQRSIHEDEDEDEHTEVTASRATFVMKPGQRFEAFVRQSVEEARARVVRRFALVFDASAPLPPHLTDVLAEELLHAGVREVGLVHPSASLETVAAALRLRLPSVRIALAKQVGLR